MSSKDLCEELLVEIILRLPPKSLLRFRSVSKSLCDRIDSPGFIGMHTLQSPKKFLIRQRIHDKVMCTMHSEMQLSSYVGITPVEYPFGDFYRCIVGSCNGIICVYNYLRYVIHLWNPSISRKVTLHDHRPPSGGGRFVFTHGFGFDPIIDYYKILRISKASTFVYTMKMNTWRKITYPGPQFVEVRSCQCLFNGALHWVALGCSDNYSYYILRFDLSSEVFSKIELPRPSISCRMTIIKGCLAVLFADDYSRIWMRNTAAASWSSVAIEVDEHRYLNLAHGDLLYSVDSQGILVYNLETEARSTLVNLGAPNSSCIIDVITLVQSRSDSY